MSIKSFMENSGLNKIIDKEKSKFLN